MEGGGRGEERMVLMYVAWIGGAAKVRAADASGLRPDVGEPDSSRC